MKQFLPFFRKSIFLIFFTLLAYNSYSVTRALEGAPAPQRLDFKGFKGHDRTPKNLAIGDTIDMTGHMNIHPINSTFSFTAGNGNHIINRHYLVLNNFGDFYFTASMTNTPYPYRDMSAGFTLGVTRFVINKKSLCDEDEFLLTAYLEGQEYQWFFNDELIDEEKREIEVKGFGTYTAKVLKDGQWYDAKPLELKPEPIVKIKTEISFLELPEMEIGDSLNIKKYVRTFPTNHPVVFSFHDYYPSFTLVNDSIIVAVRDGVSRVFANIEETEEYLSAFNSEDITLNIPVIEPTIKINEFPVFHVGDTIDFRDYVSLDGGNIYGSLKFYTRFHYRASQTQVVTEDGFHQVYVSFSSSDGNHRVSASSYFMVESAETVGKSFVAFNNLGFLEIGDTIDLNDHVVTYPKNIEPVFLKAESQSGNAIELVDGSIFITDSVDVVNLTATIPTIPDLVLGSTNGSTLRISRKKTSISFKKSFGYVEVGDTLNLNDYVAPEPADASVWFDVYFRNEDHDLEVINDSLLVADHAGYFDLYAFVRGDEKHESSRYIYTSVRIDDFPRNQPSIRFYGLSEILLGDTINLKEYIHVTPEGSPVHFETLFGEAEILQDSLLVAKSTQNLILRAKLYTSNPPKILSDDMKISVVRNKTSSITLADLPNLSVGDTLNLRDYITTFPLNYSNVFFDVENLNGVVSAEIVNDSFLIAKGAGDFTVSALIPCIPEVHYSSEAKIDGYVNKENSTINFKALPTLSLGDTLNLKDYVTTYPQNALVHFELISGQAIIQDSLLAPQVLGNFSIRASIAETAGFESSMAQTHTLAEKFILEIIPIDDHRVRLHSTLEGEHYYWFHENHFIGAGAQDKEVVLENGDYFVDVYKNGKWYRSNVVNNVIPEHFDLIKTKNSNGTFTLSSPLLGDTYYWFKDDRFNPNQKENKITVNQSGLYFLDVYIQGRGWIRSNYLDLDIHSGEVNPNLRNINVYPNTIDQELKITLDYADVNVKIYDDRQQVVYNQNTSDVETLEVSPANWTTGYYLIHVTFGNNSPKVFRVYKR